MSTNKINRSISLLLSFLSLVVLLFSTSKHYLEGSSVFPALHASSKTHQKHQVNNGQDTAVKFLSENNETEDETETEDSEDEKLHKKNVLSSLFVTNFNGFSHTSLVKKAIKKPQSYQKNNPTSNPTLYLVLEVFRL